MICVTYSSSVTCRFVHICKLRVCAVTAVVWESERERERERERDRERDTERHRETQREREIEEETGKRVYKRGERV